MAIIIPSKNIYEIDNPKVRNNLVDNVSVETKVVKKVTNYDTTVHNEKPNPKDGTYLGDNKKEQTIGPKEDGDGNYLYPLQSYGKVNQLLKSFSFSIPKVKGNKRIEKIYSGKRPQAEEGENSGYWGAKSITYERKTVIIDTTDGQVVYKYGSNSYGVIGWNFEGFFNINDVGIEGRLNQELISAFATTTNNLQSQTVEFSYNDETKVINIDDFEENQARNQSLVTSINDTANLGNLQNVVTIDFEDTAFGNDTKGNTFEVVENKDSFQINNIVLPTGREITNIFRFAKFSTLPPTSETTKYVACQVKATKTIYEATSIVLEFQGVEIGVDLKDGSIKIQEGNKPYSLSGNELLQDSGKVGNANLADYLGNKVLSQYAKGKETAVLRCDINDYKENGRLVISPKLDKKTFYIGDRVIPMVYGEDGNDKPMSRTQDGSAKEFVVVGRDVFFDGAVWQTLYLQEV